MVVVSNDFIQPVISKFTILIFTNYSELMEVLLL